MFFIQWYASVTTAKENSSVKETTSNKPSEETSTIRPTTLVAPIDNKHTSNENLKTTKSDIDKKEITLTTLPHEIKNKDESSSTDKKEIPKVEEVKTQKLDNKNDNHDKDDNIMARKNPVTTSKRITTTRYPTFWPGKLNYN